MDPERVRGRVVKEYLESDNLRNLSKCNNQQRPVIPKYVFEYNRAFENTRVLHELLRLRNSSNVATLFAYNKVILVVLPRSKQSLKLLHYCSLLIPAGPAKLSVFEYVFGKCIRGDHCL
jgi:hypothetical protein